MTQPRSRTRTAATAALVALALPGLASLSQAPAAHAEGDVVRRAAPGSGISLTLPRRQVVEQEYGNTVYSDLGLRLLNTSSAPLEIRSTRASYTQPVRVRATTAAGEVALPNAASIGTLDNLVTLRLKPVAQAGKKGKGGGKGTAAARQRKPRATKKASVRRFDACVGAGGAERARPDAPARSPYPATCSYNPYALGGVQGVQQGWGAALLGYRPLKLKRGRYDVTATIRDDIADALGMSAAERTSRSRIVVKRSEYYEPGAGFRVPVTSRRSGTSTAGSDTPVAALHHPGADPDAPGTPEALPQVDGPRPDLRSLPAWGISLSASGKYLQFGATVWNGGNSPLVVDGFRRARKDVMDGYQYFFDADGDQVGYQPVGTFEWDGKDTHQHWHFQDFATYSLLRADKSVAVRSRKEAFCLANTDAVDLTVPDADWTVENEELETSCGDHGSRSIREVLAAGWGDTYAQFRAGQSFKISDLPNGTYYIEVRANPVGNLVESDKANNVALRKVTLSGRKAARKVTVAKVGIVKESTHGIYGEF